MVTDMRTVFAETATALLDEEPLVAVVLAEPYLAGDFGVRGV